MLTLGPKGKGYTMDVPTDPTAANGPTADQAVSHPRYKVWVGDLPRLCSKGTDSKDSGPRVHEHLRTTAGHAMAKHMQ
jgi:hypothetical protein